MDIFRRWVDERGYVKLFMPEGYLHPELEWSKKYLIDGKYLRSKYIDRHVNFDPLDNRLENLWICENKNEHIIVETSLNSLVDNPLRSGFIILRNGKYLLNL